MEGADRREENEGTELEDIIRGTNWRVNSDKCFDWSEKTQNLFHIEYMAKRNLINVIYVSNIEVNI